MLLVLLALSALSAASASFCDPSAAGWRQAWRDDFDGGALNLSSWTVDRGANDSRVRDSQGTAANVYLDNHGHLVLRAQRQQDGAFNFTSGAVQSQGKRAFRGPARVCVSALLPASTANHGVNPGIWPAHWLMPDTKACWPTNGEIDIMEMINSDGQLHGTYHWSEATCGNNSQKGNHISMPKDWKSTFHEFAVEYAPDYIAFALDGKIYANFSKDEVEIFDVPYYVILNTAVGGPWPDPVDSRTVFPSYHLIDFVSVVVRTSFEEKEFSDTGENDREEETRWARETAFARKHL